MPRAKQGGKREGKSQTSYANRTDLNERGPQPITAAPGQAYGERQMQEDAQRAVPMGGTSTPPPSAMPNVVAPSPEPSPLAGAPGAIRNPMPGLEPGTLPFLHPTARPEEPVTQGNNTPLPGVAGSESLSEILGKAASAPNATSSVQALADFAKLMGL